MPTDESKKPSPIKCLVWDLDQTLWNGVLLEDRDVVLRHEALQAIRKLDDRGILQSIASKNDPDVAMAKLQELGVAEYFLYPRISWSSKVASLENIAKSLNIGIASIALIDDEVAEREEVKFSLPDVRCYEASQAGALADLEEFTPPFTTEDSRNRRRMYLADMERISSEQAFVGPKEAFLASLAMVFTISRAREEDLQRAEELTVRTNQLNTTGYTYSYEELDRLRTSGRHDLYVASLRDRFGDYGKIGLALVEREPSVWTLRLLLMSCRVMNRGVGTILLGHVMRRAHEAGVRLRAEYIPNGRNRMMLITYAFAGFKQVASESQLVILESAPSPGQPPPSYVTVRVE